MHSHKTNGFTSGMLWLIFSGSATLSVFILPVHFWAFANGYMIKLDHPVIRVYFFVLFFAALFHGLYRTKTILFDLGIGAYQKVIGYLLVIIFFASLAWWFGVVFLQ